jgi:hypothetical protein
MRRVPFPGDESEVVSAWEPARPELAHDWLLAEYTLLNEHYFHEDKLFMNVTNIFSTINGLLLVVVVGSQSNAPHQMQVTVPVFGILLCVTWWASLYRIRRWRRNLEEAIKELEANVRPLLGTSYAWALQIRPDGSTKTPTRLKTSRWTRRLDVLPTTRLLLVLPLGIALIWLVVGYFLVVG